MKTKAICLLALTLLATATLAAPDSLACRMVDYLHVRASEFFDRPATIGCWDYSYSGNLSWDLAMGDSILVWLPGTDQVILVNAYDSTSIDTFFYEHSGSMNERGVAIKDSFVFIVGRVYFATWKISGDSLVHIFHDWTYGADYHYAVIEDTFLYTYTIPAAIECINIANPESIFVARTYSQYCNCGFEVLNGYVYCNYNLGNYDSLDYEWYVRITRTDMTNSQEPLPAGSYRWDNFQYGPLTTDGEFVYTALTDINPYHPFPYWYHYSNYLMVMHDPWTNYTFDSRWDSAGVFGLEVIDSNLIAAGFKHGFSILNICNLDSIEEVAYYFDPDSEMNFTHFAMKDNRLYAMGHPSEYWARLYLFILGDSVVSNQCELDLTPDDFRLRSYPNPFNSYCNLEFSEILPRKSEIQIFNLNGQLVDSRDVSLKKSFVWVPDNLPTGLYLARLRRGNAISTIKLVYLA